MKIVFMGTPTFGREILKCLHQNGYDVVLAVCQPDKYVGRKHVLTSCEVKQYCIENNIEVFQPVKIREDAESTELQPFMNSFHPFHHLLV